MTILDIARRYVPPCWLANQTGRWSFGAIRQHKRREIHHCRAEALGLLGTGDDETDMKRLPKPDAETESIKAELDRANQPAM